MSIVGFFPEIEEWDAQIFISEVAEALYQTENLAVVRTTPEIVKQ